MGIRSFIVLFFVLAGSISAFSSQLSYQLRLHSLPSQVDYLEPGVLHTQPIGRALLLQLGARAGLSSHHFQQFSYKAELTLPVSLFSVSARLAQHLYLPERMALTDATLRLATDIPVAGPLRFVASFGWYERFGFVSHAPILPQLWSAETRDHDWMVRLGFAYVPEPRWTAEAHLGTFDAMETFRLNNPYVQLTVGYQWNEKLWIETMVRYRITLGFGRLDEFTTGFEIRQSLDSPETPAN